MGVEARVWVGVDTEPDNCIYLFDYIIIQRRSLFNVGFEAITQHPYHEAVQWELGVTD